jgi:hypothetical protein
LEVDESTELKLPMRIDDRWAAAALAAN